MKKIDTLIEEFEEMKFKLDSLQDDIHSAIYDLDNILEDFAKMKKQKISLKKLEV